MAGSGQRGARLPVPSLDTEGERAMETASEPDEPVPETIEQHELLQGSLGRRLQVF